MEFSDYVENLDLVSSPTGAEILGVSSGGSAKGMTAQQIVDLVPQTGGTFEFGRAWSSELLFDKNSIYYADHTQTGAINFTIAAAGNLVDKDSVIRQRITSDGINTISFTGFDADYIKGITSGDILPAGNYEFWFAYANGTVSVSVPGEGESVTSSNAVNRNGDNIELGGAFTKNTSHDGGGFHWTIGANSNRLGNLRGWADVISWDAETAANFQVGSSTINLNQTEADFGCASGDISFTPAGHVITDNLATPKGLEYNADYSANYSNRSLVDKAYVDAAALGIVSSWKAPVKVATTVNGTLATAYENGDTVDGIVLVTGDRILLKNQTTQTENGIYIVAASGAPSRSSDANTAAELEGVAVMVQQGTAGANTTWIQTTDNITIGSSNIVWAQMGTTVPDADASTKGIAKLYTSTGSNTDGSMDQNSITNALALKSNVHQTIATKTADYTTVLSDVDSLLIMDSVTNHIFTIPPNSSVAYSVGDRIYFMRTNTGTLTIAQGAGVSITGAAGVLTDPGQNTLFFIEQTATDVWTLQNGTQPTTGVWQSFTPGFTGFSANPTAVDGAYSLTGKTFIAHINMTNGTSNATTFTITGLPVGPRVSMNIFNQGGTNNGTVIGTVRMDIAAGNTSITLYTGATGAGWTASGAKGCFLHIFFEAQ